MCIYINRLCMDNKKIVIIGLIMTVAVVGAGLFFTTNFYNNTSPETENPNSHTNAMNTLDADKPVSIQNEFNETINVNLRIRNNDTGQIVHNQSYSVEANEDLNEVYNLNELNPDGIQEFEIVSSYNGSREIIAVRTNNCYGNVYVEITQTGELYPYYAIC